VAARVLELLYSEARAATEGRPYSCLHKASVYIRLHVAGA